MTQQESGSARLNQFLADMSDKGGFPVAVVTDAQGLAIASACRDGRDTDRHSAVVASVQKMAAQVARQLDLGTTDEITMNTESGQRLVCRPFQVNGHELILAVIVPERDASYRRATNQIINEIRETWKQFWE
jgi:predicted regulator of Ras-like GTPase activity (Roadblock/LC7/MglB family)